MGYRQKSNKWKVTGETEDEPAPIETAPRIVFEPPFGADQVPDRFIAAWQALLSQCPIGLALFVWEAAKYDAALLFGDFGRLLDDYKWTPGDLFDVPHDGKHGGLAWFIRGSPVVAIGRDMAQTQDGRIWRAAR
jgi:hypothetical protein